MWNINVNIYVKCVCVYIYVCTLLKFHFIRVVAVRD